MRAYFPMTCSLVLAALSGCSGRPSSVIISPKPAASVAAPASKPAQSWYISPSILLPDLPADTARIGLEPDGSRRVILAQMRILEHPDGSIERAASLLPSGQSRMLSVELPTRLGGGFVFVASGSSSSQIWRASNWLASLEPVASAGQPIHEILAGFDRLYLRHAQNGPLYGLDLDKAEYTDFGRLPPPLRIGPAFFADPWRAVVVTDLRGPLATFDAGSTWFPLGIRSPVVKVDGLGDRIRIAARDEVWTLSADGVLASTGPGSAQVAASEASATQPAPRAAPSQDRPLGPRPLRVAIERGLPIDNSRAVLAHGGNLALVDLKAGSLLEVHPDAYPKSFTECTAIPLGPGIGFVCGEQHGATTLFRWDRPFRMTAVMHWPVPRAIFSGGNGTVVARAPCPGAATADGLSQYCVRNFQGVSRELRFKGDIGAERVVAFADGRIAILIAPRPGAEGRLVVLKGDKSLPFVLDFQGVPRPMVEMARRGLWMNGAHEISPGVIGIWIESGGPVFGLRIDDKGHVSAGPVQKTSSATGDIITSGRFGLVWKSVGRGMESTDGGMTWKELNLPTTLLRSVPEKRACGPVGCVVGGWMRVGWGPTRNENDLETPPKPPMRYIQQRTPRPITLQCEATGRTSPAPATQPAPQPQQPARTPARYGYGYGGHLAVAPAGYGAWQAARWLPFGPLPAPALGADEEGLSTSSRDYGEVRPGYRIYVWGPKSADWSRSGHWLIRFDDPFDAVAIPRSTMAAVSPWSDISSASAILNSRSDQAWFDPEMRSGVLGWCQGPRQCKFFGIAPGELPVPFLSADPAGIPNAISAIRSEDNWYLLTSSTAQELELWVVNLSGIARKLSAFPRLEYGEQHSLIRRARSEGIALLTTSPLPGRSSAEWIVLPLDPSTGQIVDAIRVGPTDLDGHAPPACARDQDGWQFDSIPGSVPNLILPGRQYVSDVRARLRGDPGRICIAGMAGRVRPAEDAMPRPARIGAPAQQPKAVSLSVWEGDQGRKIEYRCQPPSTTP